jgi:hypothetical protein
MFAQNAWTSFARSCQAESLNTFPLAPLRSPSSHFRRLTKAHEELANYVDAWKRMRASTAPSLRMERETRTAALRSACADVHAHVRAGITGRHGGVESIQVARATSS